MRLAILGSTRGTHMLALIDAINNKQLAATIELVISNKAHALILERAKENHLNHHFIDPKGLSREAYDQQISTLLHQHQIDLVLLIGYMRILSAAFTHEWQNKILNIHPSLLPAFAGLMDLDVHRAVLTSGIKETGCTVHYVTADVDAGPIVLQKKCEVLVTDTPEILKTRVQALEVGALIEALTQQHIPAQAK